MLLGLSETVSLAIITTVGSILTGIIAVFGNMMLKKLEIIAKTGEGTHTLVNSDRGLLLHTNMLTCIRMAEVTKDPKDVAIAEIATQAFNAHQVQQAKVDAKAGEPARAPEAKLNP